MAIYTRFGSQIEILEFIGEDIGSTYFGEPTTLTWVRAKVTYDDGTSKIRDVAITDLVADNGYHEIMEAVEQAKACQNEPDESDDERFVDSIEQVDS